MERNRSGIDYEVESYSQYLESSTGLPFPTRLIGLKEVLIGWGATWPEEPSPQDIADRDRFFQIWSSNAEQLFLDLQETHEHWICFFEVGEQEIPAHSLLKHDGEYALFGGILLFPKNIYQINYAHFHQVPQEALEYDLPLNNYSSIRQLYIGDTRREVAFSLNQLRSCLTNGGDLRLSNF